MALIVFANLACVWSKPFIIERVGYYRTLTSRVLEKHLSANHNHSEDGATMHACPRLLVPARVIATPEIEFVPCRSNHHIKNILKTQIVGI